jgi:hypothetical protein
MNWHRLAAVAHAGQSAVLASILDYEQLPASISLQSFGKEQEKWTVYPGYLLPTFSALSTVNHAYTGFVPGAYEALEKSKVNTLQWTEYGLSAGFMTWLIALLSGVQEISTLTTLFGLNMMMQYAGYMVEYTKANKKDWHGYMWLGWGCFKLIWLILITHFIVAVNYSEEDVPDFVYAVIWIMLGLFSTFGVNQYCYALDVISWSTYQRVTIGLSLITKSVLIWMVYGGLVNMDVEEA